MRVIVVGAGIVGSSLAWHLAREGADVDVLARDFPGDGIGATFRSFAWLNAGRDATPAYRRFRLASLDHWHRIFELEPAIKPTGQGSLLWNACPDKLRTTA